jgi:cobalt-zinc-cadmium efflux system protein
LTEQRDLTADGEHPVDVKASRVRRLAVVLALNLLLVAGLVVVGFGAHSLGVLAAGVDFLADAAAIGVSLFAIRLQTRAPSARRPGGFPRATTVAAGVNAGWLLVLNVLIALTAISRLASGAPAVHGLPVLIASAIAAAVMLACALILGGDLDDDDDDGEEDLNVKAVLLDTAADAAAAGGVAVGGAIILAAHGAYWLDPAIALAIALVVGFHAALLLRKVATAWKAAV